MHLLYKLNIKPALTNYYTSLHLAKSWVEVVYSLNCQQTIMSSKNMLKKLMMLLLNILIRKSGVSIFMLWNIHRAWTCAIQTRITWLKRIFMANQRKSKIKRIWHIFHIWILCICTKTISPVWMQLIMRFRRIQYFALRHLLTVY